MLVMRGLDIGPRTSTLHPEEYIVGIKVQDIEVGLKISTTLHC